jgi:hypothetical protein
MPAPSTGKVVIKIILITAIAHEIKQKFRTLIPALFASWIETKNVMAPNSEERPSTCKNNIASDTAADDE